MHSAWTKTGRHDRFRIAAWTELDIDHNSLRDRIAADYHSLAAIRCSFCGFSTPLVTTGVVRVVTEHPYRGFRADVAALDERGCVVAVIEVINTNAPSDEALAVHSELESALYVRMDCLDEGFSGFCSPFCWTNRGSENMCPWSVPACEICDRPYHTLDFTERLVNWEDSYEYCLECAAGTPDGQWREPGELALGDPRDRFLGRDADVLDRFLVFSDADFWAMVWASRTAEVNEPRRLEEETAARLNEVESAFDSGDWDEGTRLLQPIGAPTWDRPSGPALYAWRYENCVRTARAWKRLREYRLNCLPESIQAAIRSRPSVEMAIENQGAVTVTHRGFPDGRFTACGIDRRASDGAIVATMTGAVTCRGCGLWVISTN